MTKDTAALEEAEAIFAARDDYIIYRSRCGTCDQCGSSDGMRAFDRVAVRDHPRACWQWAADPHHLYAACGQCNPGGHVPKGYQRLFRGQISEWLRKPCDCTACLLDREEKFPWEMA